MLCGALSSYVVWCCFLSQASELASACGCSSSEIVAAVGHCISEPEGLGATFGVIKDEELGYVVQAS